MNTISSGDFTDFTDGDFNGWQLKEENSFTTIENENENFFVRTRSNSSSGFLLEKSIPGFEVGRSYEFKAKIRLQGPEGTYLVAQFFFDWDTSSMSQGMELELGVKAEHIGKWFELTGTIVRKWPARVNLVAINIFGNTIIDIDDIFIETPGT